MDEQLSGWYTKLRRTRVRDELVRIYQRYAQNVQMLSRFQILAFPKSALVLYDQLKAMKLNIGKKDLCIAAITQDCGGVLITRNQRDFQRVANLQIEDWSI